MTTVWNQARRAARMNPSIIREILKVTEKPGILSMAGGLPSADTFPVDALKAACDRVLSQAPREALQYAASEGFAPLREWVAARLATLGMQVQPDQVLITSGSQQGLDLVGKILCDAGAPVAVETPTYLGALQAFTPFEPLFTSLASDAQGPLPEALAALPQGANLAGGAPGGSTSVGSTIAVVGTGLLQIYPKAHTALARRIAQHGLLLSEFLLDTPALRANFPKRNRIVAALARGTLVVEAAVQSGSLITARLASEMGREVLAIPGSIHAPQARGCHALIKQGAKLVETAQDVLEELRVDVPVARHPGVVDAGPQEAPGADDPLLLALGFDPVSQEALSARTGMGPAELGARLLELELSGDVARLPGQLFQRLGRA